MTNEELLQEVKILEEQIKDLKVKLEEKAEKKPYEVEVPKDLGNYYFVSECGAITLLKDVFFSVDYEKVYQCGLAFKTKEEVEQHDRERILLFKLPKWAEEHNGGWIPEWENYQNIYFIKCDCEIGTLLIERVWTTNYFSKLPYFKSEEIAQQFIEEFGDEIIEALC